MKKYLCFLWVLVFAFSCGDDAPDTSGLVANTNLSSFLSDYPADGIYEIDENAIVTLAIIANNGNGNFPNELVLADGNIGLSVIVSDGVENGYAVGRSLVLDLNGQFLIVQNGNYRLGISANSAQSTGAEYSQSDFGSITELTTNGTTISPLSLSTTDLKDDHLNRLIELNDIEFISNETNLPFVTNGESSTFKQISDCNGDVLSLLTYATASFAEDLVKEENGSLIGVYSRIHGQNVLRLRDFNELDLLNIRCDESSIPEFTFSELRQKLENGITTIGEARISGVVISDKEYGNHNVNELYLQNDQEGINIKFTAAHNFAVGDEIEVSLSENTLTDVNGLFQVIDVPLDAVSVLSDDNEIEPFVLTIDELLSDYNKYESTLIQLENVSLTGNTVYDGIALIENNQGQTIPLSTSSGASFSNESLINSAYTLTAIATEFEGPVLRIRSLDDIYTNPFGNGGVNVISLEELRDAYNMGMTIMPNNKLRGVVISDYENGNVLPNTVVIQQDMTGIELVLEGPHAIPIDSEIEVELEDASFLVKDGRLQIVDITMNKVTVIGIGIPPLELLVTIQDILNDPQKYESTLLTIAGVSFSGGSIYSDNIVIDDNSASLPLDTYSTASFANDSVSSNGVSIRGILSFENGPKFMMRNLFDVIE